MSEIIRIRRLEGLAARRKACGYTQETFAEALGVQRAALAAWETLRSFPSAGLLPAIADLLLCTIDDLYKAPEEETPPHQSPAATTSPQGEAMRADEELRFCAAGGGDSKSGISAAVGKPEDSVSPNGFPGTARRTVGPYEDSIPDREGA